MFSTRKRCLIGFPTRGYQNFYSLPPKIGFWAQKRPNLAQNWHFGPNIGIFGPFDLMPEEKNIRTSCLGGCDAGCISHHTYLLYINSSNLSLFGFPKSHGSKFESEVVLKTNIFNKALRKSKGLKESKCFWFH